MMMNVKQKRAIDLSPAKWIWVPSARTLPNTFAKFKHKIIVNGEVVSAKGYVLGCSRYLLKLNDERVQWGPAPADPRYEEADTLDLTGLLIEGENTLDFLVCYFGHGEGTWVAGYPGLIFKIEIQYADGRTQLVISDKETLAGFDNAHPAGQYKRWFLRALQEEYDAREEDNVIYENAMELRGPANKPSYVNGYGDYLFRASPANRKDAMIRKREIPMPVEYHVNGSLFHCGTVTWKRNPDDWFRFRVPDCFDIREGLEVEQDGDGYSFIMPEEDAAYLTFVMPEEGVGYIDFEVDAPEGTIIEAIVQESHDKNKTLWLDSSYYAWVRFICKEGHQHFMSFDTEAIMYLQLHIRNAKGKIKITNPGLFRRVYPTMQPPVLETDDKEIQKLFDASINTLRNSIIENVCDGMGRERQQYAGDGAHQVSAFSYIYGAHEPVMGRFFETFTDGITSDGYYLDCWPGYDRTVRMSQVQLGMTGWGPILDHTLQLILESYRHYLHTGNDELLQKSYQDFLKFHRFSLGFMDEEGLFKVENLVKVGVWLDHTAFRKGRDRRCPYNLYYAGMLENALAPICEHFGEVSLAQELRDLAAKIVDKVKEIYYDATQKVFIDNKPFIEEDGYETVSDRTLSMALLYGYYEDPEPSVKLLKEMPTFVGGSYPCNMVWNYRALAKFGEVDAVTEDLKKRWYTMPSVAQNNSLQEFFDTGTDSFHEWSHCPMGAIIAAYEGYMGLVCEKPGFEEFSVRPNLGMLNKLHLEAKTISGNIDFSADSGQLTVTFPSNMRGYIYLPNGEKCELKSGEIYHI